MASDKMGHTVICEQLPSRASATAKQTHHKKSTYTGADASAFFFAGVFESQLRFASFDIAAGSHKNQCLTNLKTYQAVCPPKMKYHKIYFLYCSLKLALVAFARLQKNSEHLFHCNIIQYMGSPRNISHARK
jgi:hypothetical protein